MSGAVSERERILSEGRRMAAGIYNEAVEDIREGADRDTAMRLACLACYDLGLDRMADVAQPMVGGAELETMEALDELGRESAAMARLRALSPETVALAINGVIRHLLLARAEWALKGRFPLGEFRLPREEAAAMAATVEAALGLDTERLDRTDLFDPLP
jgi:hypothetical protein